MKPNTCLKHTGLGLLLFLLLAGADLRAQDATLHLLTCIDDVNADVRDGCRKDGEKAMAIFGAIAQDAGMRFDHQALKFNQNDLQKGLERLHCNNNDVVVFLFSGHGFKFELDDEEWRWPILFLCDKSNFRSPNSLDCEFDLDLVQLFLQQCGARMTITLGDCCNNLPDSPASKANKNAADYPSFGLDQPYNKLELFTLFQGHIIASAASPGETGMTTDEDGSNFSNAFLNNLYKALQPDAPETSWQQLLENTRQAVMAESPGQTPQYWIEH